MQSKVAECIEDRGHVYDYPQYVNYWDGLAVTESHGSASLLDPIGEDFNSAAQLGSSAVRHYSGDGLDGTGEMRSPAFEGALDRCNSAGDGAHEPVPPEVYELSTKLDVFLKAETNNLGYELGRYSTCLAKKGFDFRSPWDLSEWVGAQFPPPPETPYAGEPGTDAWNEAVELERAAAAADAACRVDILEEGMLMVGPKLDEWTASHQTELEQIDQIWASWVEEAQTKPQWSQVRGGLVTEVG